MNPIKVRIKATGQVIDMVPARAYQMIADNMAEKVEPRAAVQGNPIPGNFTTSGVANVDPGVQNPGDPNEDDDPVVKAFSGRAGATAVTQQREVAATPGAKETGMLGPVGRVTQGARAKFAEVFGN